jgi:hypothetical protein
MWPRIAANSGACERFDERRSYLPDSPFGVSAYFTSDCIPGLQSLRERRLKMHLAVTGQLDRVGSQTVTIGVARALQPILGDAFELLHSGAGREYQ